MVARERAPPHKGREEEGVVTKRPPERDEEGVPVVRRDPVADAAPAPPAHVVAWHAALHQPERTREAEWIAAILPFSRAQLRMPWATDCAMYDASLTGAGVVTRQDLLV